ncbi:MAG: glycosyltransferase family 39 protein [Elusimicrobiales bacterium]|nr:glycosyltransferase family 39 protein [Elusimicrobiales bacterium]
MKKKSIIIMFCVALVLRAVYAFGFPLHELVADALDYDTIAWNIASGFGFSLESGVPTPIRAPMYSFFLSIIYFIFGHSLLMATLAQALLGSLICFFVYDIGNRLFSEKVGLLAAWLYCFYPVSIAYSGLLLSETLFTFLFVLAISFFIRSENGNKKYWLILSCCALGVTTLTRPTTILFPAGIFMALLISGVSRPIRKILLVALAFGFVILPWTIRNYKQFNVFLPVATGGSTCLYATGCMAEGSTYDKGMKEAHAKWKKFKTSNEFSQGLEPNIKFDRQLKKEGVEMIKNNLTNYAGVVLKRIPKYWLSSHSSVFGVDKSFGEYLKEKSYFPVFFRAGLLLFHGVLMLMAFMGMIYSLKSFRNWSILPLIFLYFNMHILFDMCPRYFIPIFPYIFIFCSVFIIKASEKINFMGGIEKSRDVKSGFSA